MNNSIKHLENTPWTVRPFGNAYSVVDADGWEIGQWKSLKFAQFIANTPDLLEELKDLEQTLALLLPNVKDNHVAVSMDEAALRHKLQRAKAVIAAAQGGATG